MPSDKSRWGRRLLLAIAVVLFIAAWNRERQPVPPVVAATAATTMVTQSLSGHPDPQTPLPPTPPTRPQLLQNYQLADQTLCSYAEASQYPAGSRPMAQNADQAYPNRPVTEAHPMRLDGGGTDSQVRLQTAQSRVHMASGESVTFTLRAIDQDGATLPLVITQAVAAGISYGTTRPNAQVALAFADAGAGTFTGTLAPAQTGLASFDGTIRTQVTYSVNGKTGRVAFDVIYSPVLPAVWTGAVRDARENGSLVFFLKMEARVAGRYIVTGRIDDANGAPFALLTFNDLLPTGPNEVRLTAFGKLLRDGEPALPLVLRDVDGYLLRENADPDRALMPRLEGIVATSHDYPVRDFSDAPYDGEERARYLAEFGKDLRLARDALLRDDPHGVVPPSACAPAAGRSVSLSPR